MKWNTLFETKDIWPRLGHKQDLVSSAGLVENKAISVCSAELKLELD